MKRERKRERLSPELLCAWKRNLLGYFTLLPYISCTPFITVCKVQISLTLIFFNPAYIKLLCDGGEPSVLELAKAWQSRNIVAVSQALLKVWSKRCVGNRIFAMS